MKTATSEARLKRELRTINRGVVGLNDDTLEIALLHRAIERRDAEIKRLEGVIAGMRVKQAARQLELKRRLERKVRG